MTEQEYHQWELEQQEQEEQGQMLNGTTALKSWSQRRPAPLTPISTAHKSPLSNAQPRRSPTALVNGLLQRAW